ncbi:MAG: adenylate/guanylate cyclase domain-containing protein, partial [Ignavibacteriales bacterium]|nr:adenylate/guanylate cyclase domain-containing protein [Ignavibacteriales bacterium]
RVCIMFLDIRGFTSFAEKHSPEEIVQYQNAFFTSVVDVVDKNNGIINQFLGDGAMITFGAPVSKGNDCQNALNTALEILERIKMDGENGKIHMTTVGIGIHVGEAVTGNVGSSKRKQYSITGNVVICASRIEQLNKEYNSQLLISKDLFDGLDEKPVYAEHLGPVTVKGREEPIEIYKLM